MTDLPPTQSDGNPITPRPDLCPCPPRRPRIGRDSAGRGRRGAGPFSLRTQQPVLHHANRSTGPPRQRPRKDARHHLCAQLCQRRKPWHSVLLLRRRSGRVRLASVDNYLSAFDEGLTDYIDIVFVDQRCVGAGRGLSCPMAQARFDSATVSLDAPEAALATAKGYVRDCVAELDAEELLPAVNSDQAIRDFEAFRQAIGSPKVWLYGESYGTQVAQAYATTYPQAVRGVILDGVVDLSLGAERFYASYTTASERLLTRMFDACAALAACAGDLDGDPAKTCDDLAARLAVAPIPVDLRLSDGSIAKRDLTTAFLEGNAFYALYSPEGRAGFLRVLAAAGRGNLAPMLRLGYSNMYIDPETEAPVEDPGWYPAAFYAITCTDYDSGPGTADERAAAILEEARAFAPNAPRLLRVYFVERLACAYWPHQGPSTRSASCPRLPSARLGIVCMVRLATT
ncbi:MAG: hypothetical protein C0524_01635 [Rhodobacter sp.]|nr:hypothetical protein [Rhodobacter sp.]